MSNVRIVFKDADGSVSVIVPTDEVLEQYTAEQVAAKDVPEGLAYKIVTVDDIPSDRTFRDAWDIDDAVLTDGVGGASDQF